MSLAETLSDSLARVLDTSRPDPAKLERAEDVFEWLRKQESTWASAPLSELDGQSPIESLSHLQGDDEWRQFLIEWFDLSGRDYFPEALKDVVVARAAELAPLLISLMEDQGLRMEADPGKGLVGPFAARVLGEGRVVGAVPALLSLAERLPEFTLMGDAVVLALKEIGEPAREGLLAICERHQGHVDSEPYARAVELLAYLPRQEQAWVYLRRGLREATDMVGLYISLAGDYGDPRATFHLNTILEERNDLDYRDQQSCLESIELCGGIPTAKALLNVKGRPQPEAPKSIGRNDPCPCGSGRKYKKCCGK